MARRISWRRRLRLSAPLAAALAITGCGSEAKVNTSVVSQSAIERFYVQHKRDFWLPEKRYFDIDNLRSRAAALKVKREVEGGKSFSKLALHEELTSDASIVGRERAVRAIFAARERVLSGPVLLVAAHDYSLFEVTRIVSPHYASVADVRTSIVERLTGQR